MLKRRLSAIAILLFAAIACALPTPRASPAKPTLRPTPTVIATTSGWPTMGKRHGHPVLLVDDRPFFILGVTDPVGLSLGAADPSPRYPQDFERYFTEASKLGFNTF